MMEEEQSKLKSEMKGDLTINLIEIKRSTGECNEYLYANKSENLEETDKFPESRCMG